MRALDEQSGVPTEQAPASVSETGTQRQRVTTSAGGQLAEDYWSASGGWGNRIV
jgi:hypothetical protein